MMPTTSRVLVLGCAEALEHLRELVALRSVVVPRVRGARLLPQTLLRQQRELRGASGGA